MKTNEKTNDGCTVLYEPSFVLSLNVSEIQSKEGFCLIFRQIFFVFGFSAGTWDFQFSFFPVADIIFSQ